MKASKFRQILNGLARTLDVLERRESAAAVREFAKGFAAAPTLELEDFFAAIDLTQARGGQGAKLQVVLDAIEAAQPLIVSAGTEATKSAFIFAKDLITKNRSMSILSFLGAVQAAFPPEGASPLVDAHVEELRQTVHDAAKFPGVVQRVEKLSREEVVAIASAFAFEMAKSTSKKAALERIWRMHSASESFAAKSRAMKGKSAA